MAEEKATGDTREFEAGVNIFFLPVPVFHPPSRLSTNAVMKQELSCPHTRTKRHPLGPPDLAKIISM